MFTHPAFQLLAASDASNPLAPTGLEIFITLLGLLAIVLFFYALFTIFRAPELSAGQKFLWLIAVIVFPLLGGIIWVLYYRSSKRNH